MNNLKISRKMILFFLILEIRLNSVALAAEIFLNTIHNQHFIIETSENVKY